MAAAVAPAAAPAPADQPARAAALVDAAVRVATPARVAAAVPQVAAEAEAVPAERRHRARRCSRSIDRARRRPIASRARTSATVAVRCSSSASATPIKTQFQTLEAQCDATYPACGCAARQPTADDGSRLRFTEQAGVTCLAGQVHHIRPRLRAALRRGHDLLQLRQSRTRCSRHARRRAPTAPRVHDPTLPLCQMGIVRKHVGQVLHRRQRPVRRTAGRSYGRSPQLSIR